jgi:hypothetical protein
MAGDVANTPHSFVSPSTIGGSSITAPFRWRYDMPAPLILALLLNGAAAPQTHPHSHDTTFTRDSLILDHDFTGSGLEFTRIELLEGQVYRIEVDGGRDVQIRALRSGEQSPRFGRTEPYPRASRTVSFEIIPFVTTTYEIRVGEIQRGVASLRVFRDANATARRQKLRGDS